ncbi:AMP-binding protein [Gordonia caeni]|uniref:Acyl-CoA synthetase n=1 Tax=Gordonia caeni TaxID=1007097 RepID=A0ABP7PJ97_9ACTN
MSTSFPDTHAAADPHRPAYVMASTGVTVTYGELVESSRAIAGLMHARGLGHGATVALLMENDEWFFQVAWGLQRAGLRYVALSTRLAADDIAYILGDADAAALVVSGGMTELARRALHGSPAIGELFTTGEPEGEFESLAAASAGAPPHPDEREGVDLLYSSGTTGRPKGVVAELTLAPLGTAPGFATLFHQRWGLGSGSVYLSPAPLYHAAPLRVAMTVHRYGGTVIVMESFDAQTALELIESHRVTETQMVPTMLLRILKLPVEQRRERDLSSLRCVIHAAAPMPVEAKRELIDWLGPIVREFYSATENYLFTELDSAEWLAHPGSVGRAVSGTPHILDDAGTEVPVGETGTIWSSGGLWFEYLHDPEKTATSRNERGWTTVGDLGRLDADGYLYLADRRSDLILCGGVNIYPQEAENVLAGHPDVVDAAVFGIPHAELGQVVHAAVQVRPGVGGDPDTERRLLEYLTERVSPFKCPRRLEFVDELPRLPTGKILKRVLQEQYR